MIKEITASNCYVDELPIMICECNSFEHQAMFFYEREFDQMYLTVHLTTHRNFFKRLWYGFKYAFGYKCRFGAWDEFLMKPEDRKKLGDWLRSRLSQKTEGGGE